MAKVFNKERGAAPKGTGKKLRVPAWIEKLRFKPKPGQRGAEERRGATPAGRPSYGPALDLGGFGRVRAVPGQRAAVVEMRPGMFIVTFVPEVAMGEEAGFLPMLAPAIVRTARRVFQLREPEPGAQAAEAPEQLQKQHPPMKHGAYRGRQERGRVGEDIGISLPLRLVQTNEAARGAGRGTGQAVNQAANQPPASTRAQRQERWSRVAERLEDVEIPWLDQETAGDLGLGDDGRCRCRGGA